MLCMTTTAGMVQKAAGGRKKRPPLAVKKQLIVSPSLTLPKGREFVLAVFEEVVIALLFLKKAGMGPLIWLFFFPLGKVRMGLMVDGAHPTATLKELRFHSPGLRGEAPLPWVRKPPYLATL